MKRVAGNITSVLGIAVGHRIAQLRKNLGESQNKLANNMGLASFKIISAYESGRAVPPLKSLIPLADHFGVTLDYLGRGNKKPAKAKTKKK